MKEPTLETEIVFSFYPLCRVELKSTADQLFL